MNEDFNFASSIAQFLFRMVDLELLSTQAHGDMSKLLGQFAALLIWLSMRLRDRRHLSSGGGRMPPAVERVLFGWSGEHFLIATTMLVVGLFAVLSWDSTFPDRRDVMVLAPLPIRSKTLFLAKITGVAAALSVSVISLHCLSELTWVPGLSAQPAVTFAGQSIPAAGGFLSFIRTFAAYWITMFAAGAFIFCCVLAVQGIAALVLPRRLYLRASAVMQLGAFCLFICEYLALPTAATPTDACRGARERASRVAVFVLVPGSVSAAQRFAGDARVGPSRLDRLGGSYIGYGAGLRAVLLSHAAQDRRRAGYCSQRSQRAWLPRFGDALETAIGQFSVRSLLRSRQHRIILAFYVGVGFALNILLFKEPSARASTGAWSQVSPPLLASTILMILLSVVGMRIVFAMPLDLKANWIFRMAPVLAGANCLAARRRAMLALGVLPVWIGLAALLFCVWPWRAAAGHLLILGLLGAIVTEVCLQGFQKIPFTCSYLPGKTNIQVTFVFSVFVLLQFLDFCAGLELRAMAHPWQYLTAIAALGGILLFARWRTAAQTDADDIGIQFEDEGSPAIQGLGLSLETFQSIPVRYQSV